MILIILSVNGDLLHQQHQQMMHAMEVTQKMKQFVIPLLTLLCVVRILDVNGDLLHQQMMLVNQLVKIQIFYVMIGETTNLVVVETHLAIGGKQVKLKQ